MGKSLDGFTNQGALTLFDSDSDSKKLNRELKIRQSYYDPLQEETHVILWRLFKTIDDEYMGRVDADVIWFGNGGMAFGL